ncbi:unnamed protein product [Porites lobata]|uniref:Uncharacterized protein n=1 Tax=Porites lobata TaxID=104759 RepID=A0ABN8RKX0_9CNID|nr:unnamed protein product [Porites lobata]
MNRAEKQASAKADAYKAMLEVQQSITDFLERYLNYQGRNELPEERRITQNVPLDWLDREPSRQENLDSVLLIKRQIEVSLPKEPLLKDVLGPLWKYFLFNPREQEASLTSHYHDQEWQEDTLSSRSIVEDCKSVVHILQQKTRLLEISENIGSPEDLSQPLKRILNYLKNRSIKPRKSEASTR